MSTPMEQEAVTVTDHSPSPAKGETTQPEVESSEVYEAVAEGDMTFLKAHKSEIDSFVTPTKNTILHIYIIAQSKRNRDTNIVHKLQSALKSVPSWFKYATDKPASPAKTVQAMLTEWPWLLHKANESGDTPLHMAARHGDHDVVKVLIDHAKNSHDVVAEDVEGGGQTKVEHAVWKMLHETNADRETALHQAVRYQHDDVVKVLIAEDDPSFLYLPNEDGETPLYMAAERSNYELVYMILERYASPAYEGPEGRTALHAAAIHSSAAWYDIVTKEELKCLATKVDNRGRTPLHYDAVLLRYVRSAAFITDNDGKTALHLAAGDKERIWDVWWFISNCPECFELVDGQGRNALHIAVESGNKEAVDLILKHEYFGDLLKKKDNNGNTPLHLLATFPNYWPDMIKDHRFDKMAFNKHKLNPVDIISSNQTPSKVEKSMAKRMEKAEISPGKRASTTMDPVTKINVEENNRNNKSDDEDLKEARESHLVVAALIATVTFAAGFTLPGGYIQEKGKELGYAVFTKNAAFIVFVISDTFGLVFSCAAVFIHLLMAMDGHKEKQTVGKLFGKALPLTLFAIVAMVIAFISGTYAVLAHSPSLAIPASVIGTVFFFLFGYLMEETHQDFDSFRIFHGMIHMAELLLTAVAQSFMALEQLLMALWQFYELICSGLVKVFKWCYPGVSKDDKPEDKKRFLERQRSQHRPFDS